MLRAANLRFKIACVLTPYSYQDRRLFGIDVARRYQFVSIFRYRIEVNAISISGFDFN